MSFKQSVLLPVKEYNKLLSINNKCGDTDDAEDDILMNSDIPSEIKLRLREQRKILGVKKHTKPVKVSLDEPSLTSLQNKGAMMQKESPKDTDREISQNSDETEIDASMNKSQDNEDPNLEGNDKDKKSSRQNRTNYNKPRRVYNTRSNERMLTKSKRSKLSKLGQKSLDINNKLLEHYAIDNIRRKNRGATNKERRIIREKILDKRRNISNDLPQEGKGFSWIVY